MHIEYSVICLLNSHLQFNGFLGTEVTKAFVAAGWRVRGTVRSEDKGLAWKKAHPQQVIPHDSLLYTI